MSIGYPIRNPDTGRGTSPQDMRQIVSAHWHNTGVIKGCAVSTSGNGLYYSVAVGTAVASRGSAYGAVEFMVPQGPVATTAGPSSGTRTDIVWARPNDPSQGDANPDVVLGVGPTLPTGAVELRRYTVPAGMTKTSQATATGFVQNAVAFGTSLGIMHEWIDTANGSANQDLMTLGNGTIDLPTKSSLDLQLWVTVSSTGANQSGTAIYKFIVDGVEKAAWEFQYVQTYETKFMMLPLELPAGRHTVAFSRKKVAGGDFVHRYGNNNGNWYMGTQFRAVHRGAAQ